MHHELNLNDATVVAGNGDLQLVAMESLEPNSLTLCLAIEVGGKLRQAGGRSIVLRWDPLVDEMDDDWVPPVFALLKGP